MKKEMIQAVKEIAGAAIVWFAVLWIFGAIFNMMGYVPISMI